MARCRSCDAAIVWLKTKAGKSMPVDDNEVARRYAEDEAVFDPQDEDLVSHFGTCPDSKDWRRG